MSLRVKLWLNCVKVPFPSNCAVPFKSFSIGAVAKSATAASHAHSDDKKSLLMRLRKESGFPFSKCKSALEQSNFDLTQAHNILNEWAKEDTSLLANKLAGRSAKEGILSVLTHENVALLLEVNCETDFVSRNERFRQFSVDAVAHLFDKSSHLETSISSKDQSTSSSSNISNIDVHSCQSLQDMKVEVLPFLKENIVFGKCLKIEYSNGTSVHAAVHPVQKSTDANTEKALKSENPGMTKQYGKFVSLVALKSKSCSNSSSLSPGFGQQLAYHVIAMDPKVLLPSQIVVESVKTTSSVDDVNAAESRSEDTSVSQNHVTSEEDGGTANDEEFVEEEEVLPDDSPFNNLSDALVNQNFLFIPGKTVGQLCDEMDVEIVDFHRFEMN